MIRDGSPIKTSCNFVLPAVVFCLPGIPLLMDICYITLLSAVDVLLLLLHSCCSAGLLRVCWNQANIIASVIVITLQ